MAAARGPRGEAGRLQRLPHLKPPRIVRRGIPWPGAEDDGPDTQHVAKTQEEGLEG